MFLNIDAELNICYNLETEYKSKPNLTELASEKIASLGTYDAKTFLPASKITFLGNLKIPTNKYEELFRNALLVGCREVFYASVRPKLSMSLAELLVAKNMSIFNFIS